MTVVSWSLKGCPRAHNEVCICISINSKGGGLALGQPARGLALGGTAVAAQRTATGLGGVYFLFVVPSSLHPLLVTTCTLALTGGYQLICTVGWLTAKGPCWPRLCCMVVVYTSIHMVVVVSQCRLSRPL